MSAYLTCYEKTTKNYFFYLIRGSRRVHRLSYSYSNFNNLKKKSNIYCVVNTFVVGGRGGGAATMIKTKLCPRCGMSNQSFSRGSSIFFFNFGEFKSSLQNPNWQIFTQKKNTRIKDIVFFKHYTRLNISSIMCLKSKESK